MPRIYGDRFARRVLLFRPGAPALHQTPCCYAIARQRAVSPVSSEGMALVTPDRHHSRRINFHKSPVCPVCHLQFSAALLVAPTAGPVGQNSQAKYKVFAQPFIGVAAVRFGWFCLPDSTRLPPSVSPRGAYWICQFSAYFRNVFTTSLCTLPLRELGPLLRRGPLVIRDDPADPRFVWPPPPMVSLEQYGIARFAAPHLETGPYSRFRWGGRALGFIGAARNPAPRPRG